MKRRVFYLSIIVFVVILECIFIYKPYKNVDNKDSNVDEVKLKDNILKNDSFAILLEKTDGSGYEEYKQNTWPTRNSYIYNSERSGCIDSDGITLEDVLSFDSINWIVTLTTNSTAYCYLYFDLDKVAPQVFTFYLGGSSNPAYTNSVNTKAYLNWSDNDITHYCLTTGSDSTSCTWNEVTGTSIEVDYTLSSTDGTKTVYAYLKDAAGNVSPQVTDTITLDTAAPSSNSVKINNNDAYTNNKTVTLTLSSSGASEMCISNTNTCTNYVAYATSKSHTIAGTTGTNTVYVYYKDAAGNISSVVSDTIIYDGTLPSVGASVNNNNSSNATMTITSNEAGTYCVNTSATSTASCTFTGSITAGGSITTSAFTTNGDYYAHVTDAAGNIGHSSKVSVTVSTPLGQYIIDSSISGLEKSKETGDTLYRFSGTSGNTGINNYICLGTSTKCSSGSDNMYRIIGVEPSTGYVKVIKQTKYGDNIKWNSSTGVTWPNSGAYSTMTTWYNSVSFKSMIVSHSWNIGDFTSVPTTRANALSADTGSTTTAYVGMLAVSDYYLAYKGDQNWNSSYSNYTSNWIHLANNGNTSDHEWTMSRSSSTSAWIVFLYGRVGDYGMAYSFAVRPVFYLNSTVNRISGSGTSGDPFIVG